MNRIQKMKSAALAFGVRRCRGVRVVLRVVCGAAALGAAGIFVAGCGVWLALAGGALMLLSEAAGQGARALAPLVDMLFPKNPAASAPKPNRRQRRARKAVRA